MGEVVAGPWAARGVGACRFARWTGCTGTGVLLSGAAWCDDGAGAAGRVACV